MKTVLTGIKPTGDVHLGNLLGAIRPAIDMSQSSDFERSIYFIADAHALTSLRDPEKFKRYVYEIAATWMALGLDVKRSIFFKQSDVKEVFELAWLLNCMTPKGDMNRAHSYKDRLQKNQQEKRDADHGVNMGLYSYPVLMSADILLYDSHQVPVGKDQIQHVEIARSIAQRCNEYFGAETLIEPTEVIQQNGSYVPGLDGRKMSKSYGNIIPLWGAEKKLRKTIMKIKTDSSDPSQPKDPENCTIMELYRLFANSEQQTALEQRYREGIGWGHAKEALFEVVNEYLKIPREKFNHLMENTHEIDQVLAEGSERARLIANDTMKRVRKRMTGF